MYGNAERMLNPRRDSHLLSVGAATSGAASLNDCREAGLSDRRLCDLVATGRWQSPYPRAFVTFSGPIPRATLLWAAIMYAGTDATLSDVTAGQLWRLTPESPVIHVTVPYARDADDQPGCACIVPARCGARTRIQSSRRDGRPWNERSSTCWPASPRRPRRSLWSPARCVPLGRQPTGCGCRWPSVLAPDGGRSSLRRFLICTLGRSRCWSCATRSCVAGMACRLAVVSSNASGKERSTSVLIDEFRLHVENDGRLGHDRAQEIWRDMRRDNRSELLGYRHLRYGWADLVDRGCQVALEQAEVLRQQGWRGRFRRCPHCPPGL